MTKILAIGDTHQDTSSICNVAIPKARKADCKIILQLGDFGYWPHQERGKVFLNKVSKALVREDITMYWIDGNHDNHKMLWQDHQENADGFCEIRPNLFYIPRGTVFQLGPATCLALGGAFSIDRDYRLQLELEEGRENYYYWDTEMITDAEVNRACNNVRHSPTPIDIMFTHDCPTGIDIPGVHSEGKWVYHETWINRDKLAVVFDKVQPKLLVHGHYHMRYTGKLPLAPKVGTGELLEWDYCRVDGLACNGMQGFAVILDLDSLFVVESEGPVTPRAQALIDAAETLKYSV